MLSISLIRPIPRQSRSSVLTVRSSPRRLHSQSIVCGKKEDGPKRLILLRHAKSEWEVPDGTADRDRPLAARGRKEADLVGRKLAKFGKWYPDVIFVSDTARTKETLDRVFEAAPKMRKSAEVHVVPLIYEASHGAAESDGALAKNVVEAIKANIEKKKVTEKTVMVVGHNDGFQITTSHLCGRQLEMKTADAALLKSDASSWNDALSGKWVLKELVSARAPNGVAEGAAVPARVEAGSSATEELWSGDGDGSAVRDKAQKTDRRSMERRDREGEAASGGA